jgi:carbamoyltransferase
MAAASPNYSRCLASSRSIIRSTEDAFRCFVGSELDLLVVGNCVLRKTAQDPALKIDYSQLLEAD